MFSAIVLADENNAIGYKNDLLCRIPSDLRRFKSWTLGKKVLVGRKTFETLPKSLTAREFIVATNNKNYSREGVCVCTNLKKFLEENEDSYEDIFVIGGGQIYDYAMPYIKQIYLTRVAKKFKADTFFPDFMAKGQWALKKYPRDCEFWTDKKTGLNFWYENYTKI